MFLPRFYMTNFFSSHDALATITDSKEVHSQMAWSVDHLNQKLSKNEVIYGVNTGFGGSADTRTNRHENLQKALVQHHNAAVLLPSDRGLSDKAFDMHGARSHGMPIPIVRAAMLTRCNSLLRGHSAVRVTIIEYILTLLAHRMTPIVPLRGSISASGDLTPLAYIAGALEGNPDIYIHKGASNETIPADQALKEMGLVPLMLGPKEGLGLINGTAFSAGAAGLVLFEANQLVLLSQALTAIGTEALLGTAHNYHPFIAEARPHYGQREAAGNIFNILAGSQLATVLGSAIVPTPHEGLAQDRYALRTSAQWIGPQIENIDLAIKQVTCELNSTTDNPLVDPVTGRIHHGGNFQATAITSAMEKIMTAMQMLGRLFFAQCSEIINPGISKGLPPNLSVDEPSLSFAFKGVDINMASYMSELAYLNHPVSNHVQSAEMHNQSLNSLAFVSCRYAAETVEILSLMAATYLYVLCQALDLRALHREFLKNAQPKVNNITAELFLPVMGDDLPTVQNAVWTEIMNHWAKANTKDLTDRSLSATNNSLGVLLDCLGVDDSRCMDASTVHQWRTRVTKTLASSYATARERFLKEQTTATYLCQSSRNFYTFVRERLGVSMHKGIVDHPTYDSGRSKKKENIGSQISKVYVALRKGDFQEVMLSSW
ncbi:L-Aspartase-like protein [Aspergillus floccosus]